MIANQAECPSIELLERLGSASLSDADFAAIESHVQDCTPCQSILERLSAEASDSDDAPPTIPGFVIERELGRGGMGVVYQAWQPELARRVAIKVLTHSPSNRKRWLREARAMGQVRQPNIVRLHQVGEVSERFFLVLDLIPAGSLKDWLTGPISPEVAAGLMETVARAVAQIHGAGMLHLDIKPSNILLDCSPEGSLNDAVPILADFGLARAAEDSNETASIGMCATNAPRGTPAFMAPEQAGGQADQIGPQTDVFALGSTLYTLLTGRSPFQGASVVETLDLVRTRDPVPPSNLVPGISRDLETIVFQCLRKDIRTRYASATDLANDLLNWLNGSPIKARPMGLPERALRWCTRQPAVAFLLGLLAVTIATSIVALTLLWRHSEYERRRAEGALTLAFQNEAIAAGVRTNLIELLVVALPEYRMLTPERTAELMRLVGAQTKRLCDVQGLATTDVATISMLVLKLSDIFNFSGHVAESLEILDDALRLVERYDTPGTSDRNLSTQHERILLSIGHFSTAIGRHDRAFECLERGVAVGRNSGNVDTCLDALTGVYKLSRTIAERALDEGDLALRERVLAAYLRMTVSAADTFDNVPIFRLFLATLRPEGVSVGNRQDELNLLFRAIGGEERQGKSYQNLVATWMTYEAIPESLVLNPADPGTPEENATGILASINKRSSDYEFSPELRVESAYRIFQRMLQIITAHRHKGRYDRAEHAARTLELLCRKLCQAEPSESVFHIMLSGAQEQHSRNAWRRNNRDLIRSSLREALNEAMLAYRLKPDDTNTPATISLIQNKLLGLELDDSTSK